MTFRSAARPSGNFEDTWLADKSSAWLASGLAGVVGFSRVSTQPHFPSDGFAGAVLGYAITHFVVLRRHPAASPSEIPPGF